MPLQVIVATEDSEVPRLQALYDRGRQNNVKGLRLLDLKGLKEIEPHCQVGTGLAEEREHTQTYIVSKEPIFLLCSPIRVRQLSTHPTLASWTTLQCPDRMPPISNRWAGRFIQISM